MSSRRSYETSEANHKALMKNSVPQWMPERRRLEVKSGRSRNKAQSDKKEGRNDSSIRKILRRGRVSVSVHYVPDYRLHLSHQVGWPTLRQ